jgi:hypothetical protein
MKCALPLLLLSLAAFAQTGKQPKPLTNDDAAQHDATDFVRDLRGARATQFGPAFGFVSGTFPATDAVGKTIRFSAWIKTENVQNGYAGLWWRVDGPGEGTNRPQLAFDNSMVRFIDGKPGTGNGTIRGATGTTPWTLYELELPVGKTASNINFGVLLTGTFFRNGRDRLASFDHHATTVFYLAATRSNFDQFTRVRCSSHMVYKSPYSLRSKIRPIAVELNVT